MRAARLACLPIAAIAISCGSATTTPTSVSTALSGSVTDPVGDAVNLPVFRNGGSVTPIVPVLPDLAAATLAVSGGRLTATISFAPGTLSHTDTFACLMLDTDENASTGTPSAGGDVRLGFDYSVCAVLPRASTTAQISNLAGPTAVGVGTAPATFPGANQIQFTVPLSMLGNDDGRMAFKVNALQWVDDPVVFNSGVIDVMPDLGVAAGLVR